MCTVALAIGVHPDLPLVVAANRDERFARASGPWRVRVSPSGIRFASPLDVQSGGTWLGVSSRGLVAAVANYPVLSVRYPEPDHRFRGDLVGLALAEPTLRRAREALSRIDPTPFSPFTLGVASGEGGFLLWFDGDSHAVEALGRGVHVYSECSAGGACPRCDLVRASWPADAEVRRIAALMASHSMAPLSAPCVHLSPERGTRSSAILRLAGSKGASELYAADGPPCATPYRDLSPLLRELGGDPSDPVS